MKGKKYLKSLLSLLLTFIMMFVPIAQFGITNAEAATVTIKFHYNRGDGNYSGWNIWGWPNGGNGTQLNFSSSDGYGKVATATTSAVKYGFIIRKSTAGNEWSEKDVGSDRFVEIPSGTTGVVHVYIKSGQTEFSTFNTATDAAPMVASSANIIGSNKVEVEFTDTPSSVTKDTVVLKNETNNNTLTVTDIAVNGIKATITTSEKLSIADKYTFKVSSSDTQSTKLNIDFNGEYFENNFIYDGNDLGATYTKAYTTFKVWAPTAKEVNVRLYSTGDDSQEGATELGSHAMTGGSEAEKGVWSLKIEGDFKDIYYLYEVKVDGKTNLAMDPYAKAGCTTSDNPVVSNDLSGQRSMIVDLDSTDPDEWSSDNAVSLANPTDAIIYETSVRDFSIDASSGVSKANRGKYLAFTERGTTLNGNGLVPTGIDYIKKLGVTHVQIMPSYDFAGTNEVTMAGYNWGYNPVNYNIPEGAFSSNPYDGNVRINEYKQMVQAIHDSGAGVVMDVVYNHVNNASTFSFEKIVPGYFFRGSNGSGCGNDVASERTMVRKFIVDSVAYWAEEYHLDGFRFDLVGLLDVDTMNAVRAAVDKINPDALIYGEGWTLGTSTTKNVDLATQPNTSKMPGVGMFNDIIRDATGGNNNPSKGYASGNALYNFEGLKYALKGNTSFTNNPTQLINYVSCHDNYTLWDKISKSNSGVNEATRIKMNKLAAAIIMTSQGIPFFLSGEEFLRTKNGNHNSYNSSDAENKMDWNRASTYSDVVEYYAGLIKLRKAYPEFRLTTEQVTEKPGCKVSYIETGNNILAYTIASDSDKYSSILVAFNPYAASKTLSLPSGEWRIVANAEEAGSSAIEKVTGSLSMDSYSAYVLIKGETVEEEGKEGIVDATFDIGNSVYEYTGSPIKPAVSNVRVNNKLLVEGTDYRVTYSNNINAGTAVVIVEGINNYHGRCTKSFKIDKLNSTLKVSCSTVTYGSKISPKVLTNTSKGAVRYYYKKSGSADSTYTTVKPTKAGSYVIKAVSAETSNYKSAVATTTFKINKKSISKGIVSGIAAKKVYTGKAIKFGKIVLKVDGKTLKNGTDYTVSYKNNKKIGKATLTIKAKGNYSGTIKKTFKIIPKSTKISSTNAGKRKATIKWKKVSGSVSGYQVYMSTSKNGKYKKVKTLSKSTSVKYTKKGLKKNKTYYFKVRAYKKVSGKTYYSNFSSVKSVRVK